VRINNQQSFSASSFSYAIVIPGLAVGLTKQTLSSLESFGEQLVSRGYTNRLQVILNTWEFTWDKSWVDAIGEYCKNFEHIDLHISSIYMDSSEVTDYFNRFFLNVGVEEYSSIPKSTFKFVSMFYILRDTIFKADKILSSIDSKTQWVLLKIKAPTLLPKSSFFSNGTFFSMIEEQKKRNIRLHNYKETLLMNSNLDCLMLDRLSTNFMGDDMFLGGLNSLLRVFRYTYRDLAKACSNFYLTTTLTDKIEFSNVREYEDIINTPKSNSTEPGFILSYLVKTSNPKINYTTSGIFNHFTHMRLQSPDILLDSSLKVENNNIVNRLKKAEERYGCEFILPKQIYENINYDIL
jgi:hypothetical protein